MVFFKGRVRNAATPTDFPGSDVLQPAGSNSSKFLSYSAGGFKMIPSQETTFLTIKRITHWSII